MVTSEDNSQRKTIIVCDDQQDILRACSLFLRRKYNLLTARSGEECLAVYFDQMTKGTKVHVLLLDYQLGDMTAEDVARKIKESSWGTKIILITAYELNDLVMSKPFQENLIDSQLKKPFGLAELDRKILQMLSD
ncbi:MAG: response regulator [Nitrososphaerales archaeon]